jgi:uncharacterized integral membrane protein
MAEGRRRVGSLWFVVGVLVAVPATIFALSNLESATVEFLGWQAETPLWAVIGISVLAGVLIGAALTAAIGARRRRGKRRAVRANAEVTAGAADLTEAPVPPVPDADGTDLPPDSPSRRV